MIREGKALRSDSIRYLTGEGTEALRPVAVGQKFDEHGGVMRFPGNTFICHIPKDSSAFAALTKASLALQSGPYAASFAFLPPSSFHMTVFEGVTDLHRDDARWPKAFAPDRDVETVTAAFQEAVTDLALPQHHSIRPTGIFGGFSVAVTGATVRDESSLRLVREVLRETTGILRPDFESYDFHITLAYNLRWFAQAEAENIMDLSDAVAAGLMSACPSIDLGPIEFCTFEDMHAFTPRLILRS